MVSYYMTKSLYTVKLLFRVSTLKLVAPTAQALQLLLNAPTSKLSTYKIVIRHSNKKVSTRLTMNNQPLRQLMETTYLRVVLTYDLSCTKDIERAKSAFFKQFNSIYHKISFVYKNVLPCLFRLHAMLFYGAETCYIEHNKNTLKTFPYLIKKLSNVSV